MRSIQKAPVPMVLLSCLLGALASAACGEADPDGKTGGGLTGGASGKGGSINVGTGGSSSVGKGGASGSAGTTAVSVGGTSGTSSGSSGAGGITDGGACVSVSRNSTKTEVALLFMVDISGSMNCKVPEVSPPCETDPNMDFPDTRWTEMNPALKSFFSGATDMWAGISFFSRAGSCTAADYEKPDSEIALLPAAATGLDRAVDAQNPGGQTPTVPSLQGALNHADAWAASHADQNVVVVYATDGYPKGCGSDNTIDNAASIAATAYMGAHQIRTFVLGVGPNLTDLNKIAVSGGTTAATQIDTGQGADVTQQLIDKFNAIRSQVTVECEYTVPDPPAGQVLNPDAVNVTYKSGANGMVTTIPFDDTGTCMEGWKYADATNKQVVLCGSSCDAVKAIANAEVEVAFGCQTVKVGDPR